MPEAIGGFLVIFSDLLADAYHQIKLDSSAVVCKQEIYEFRFITSGIVVI
jgi:hypothetical protein